MVLQFHKKYTHLNTLGFQISAMFFNCPGFLKEQFPNICNTSYALPQLPHSHHYKN